MFFDQLKRIKKGEVLFTVFGWTAPNEEGFDGRRVKIAEVKLKTDLYTSEFGDERLFFKHTDIRNDMVEHWSADWFLLREDKYQKRTEKSTWGNTVPDTWPSTDEEAQEMYIAQVSEHGCPFAWLLE